MRDKTFDTISTSNLSTAYFVIDQIIELSNFCTSYYESLRSVRKIMADMLAYRLVTEKEPK